MVSVCVPGSRAAVVLKWVHSCRYDMGKQLGIWYEEEGPIVWLVSRVVTG